MQKATPRIAQDRRSAPPPTPDPPVSLPPLDAARVPYDRAAANELSAWRVSLKGDPRTCDTMDLYRALVPQLGARAAIAEVGVAWGRGVIYAAFLFVERGWKGARVYAVDPWRGPGDPAGGYSEMHFSAALASLAVNTLPYEADVIHPVRVPSPAAAGCFGAGELDLVVIDGCHVYDQVLADIAAWTRTVRAGGVLAGHDYNGEFPGVQRAVDEAFGARVAARGDCWVVQM